MSDIEHPAGVLFPRSPAERGKHLSEALYNMTENEGDSHVDSCPFVSFVVKLLWRCCRRRAE